MIQPKVVQKLSRRVEGGCEQLEKLAQLADEVFLYMKAHNVMDNLPLWDPVTERAVEMNGSGTLVYVDTGEVFNGEPDVDPTVRLSGTDRTVGELLKMGNFLASFTFHFLGNKHMLDDTKTVLGQEPMGWEEAQEYRRKFTI